MIGHIVAVKWNDRVSEELIAKFEDGLRALPAIIPELISYRFGRDLGLRQGNGDFAIIAQLASGDDVPKYLDHPAHQRVVKELLAPILAERTVIQFEWEPDFAASA
jgi:hypothetical protein